LTSTDTVVIDLLFWKKFNESEYIGILAMYLMGTVVYIFWRLIC